MHMAKCSGSLATKNKGNIDHGLPKNNAPNHSASLSTKFVHTIIHDVGNFMKEVIDLASKKNLNLYWNEVVG